MSDLQSLRQQIEEINQEILHLLNKRMTIVLQIKDKKVEKGIPFFDQKREMEMIEHLVESNDGPIPIHMLKNIFQEIFKTSLLCMEEKIENES